MLCCIAWAEGAIALELDQNVQMHGYLCQAAATSDHNNLGGDSSDGFAFDLRKLGGNLSWRLDPDWLVFAQVLARWAGKTDDGDVRLDYGFVDRTLLSGDDRLWIQLGKIKNPYGLYNTTRDVAHTRPGILMPQSIYWDRIRDFVLAASGASVYGENNRQMASLRWQVILLATLVLALMAAAFSWQQHERLTRDFDAQRAAVIQRQGVLLKQLFADESARLQSLSGMLSNLPSLRRGLLEGNPSDLRAAFDVQ